MRYSNARQAALLADRAAVAGLADRARQRFGQDAVAQDPSLVWTLRCMEGMMGVTPFDALASRSWGELRYVLEQCGRGEECICATREHPD